MRTVTKTFVISTVASLVGFVLAGSALAAPITGFDTVAASVASSNNAGNLGAATQFTLGSAHQTFTGLGTGAFLSISPGTMVTLPGTLLNEAILASFGFTDPGVGTFTPAKIVEDNKSATTQDIFLTGTFTPGTLFGGGAPQGASENLALTQNNGIITLTGVFASPALPNPIPEPLPIALIGLGLVGILTLRSRRAAERS
ncbi:MAG TPA: hypothetical protein VFI23_14250 [Rhizomicrobium sp.]|nr:hypothetical protein [Rhizomicrobium sp.]